MIVVGLTGGIGSGKTTVAEIFKTYQIPIYIADTEAKKLMNTSKSIRAQLIELFGPEAYKDDELNRSFIADRIFNDKALLKKMNAIVHPKVGEHFYLWLKAQSTPYVIKEAAIIFEQHMEDEYDFIITVIADEDKRIARVAKRDHSSEEKVKAIINNQMSDAEKAKHSDFVIVNNDLKTLPDQVRAIHNSILKCIAKKST